MNVLWRYFRIIINFYCYTSSFSFFVAQSNAFVSNKVYLEVHNVEVEPRPYFEVAVKNMHL